jgi:peptide/nickel transport system permease protein
LLGVSIITFTIARVIPGNPVYLILGGQTAPEVIEKTIQELGLDKPIHIQYFIYLKNILRGDFGKSLFTNNEILFDLKIRLSATLELLFAGLTISIVIGIILGVISGIRKDGMVDHITRVVSLFGTTMPTFWLGLLLVYFLYYKLDIFPAPMGRLPIRVDFTPSITGFILIDSILLGRMDAFIGGLRQIALPSITLALSTLAAITRLTRSSMIQVLNTEYIITSTAHGIPSTTIRYRYALKNALLPTITSIGLTFGWLLGGAVLIERVFSWPGVGLYAVQSLNMKDYNAIQGFVLLSAVFYIVVFLIVDLLYFIVDPRIKH